jgi:hypothetical protein
MDAEGAGRHGLRSWFEDPRISLDGLTPGQRYTALIVILLAVLMLRFGLPRSGPAARAPDNIVPAAPAPASLVPRPAPSDGAHASQTTTTTTTPSRPCALAGLPAPVTPLVCGAP